MFFHPITNCTAKDAASVMYSEAAWARFHFTPSLSRTHQVLRIGLSHGIQVIVDGCLHYIFRLRKDIQGFDAQSLELPERDFDSVVGMHWRTYYHGGNMEDSVRPQVPSFEATASQIPAVSKKFDVQTQKKLAQIFITQDDPLFPLSLLQNSSF